MSWLRAGLSVSQAVVAQPDNVVPSDYWGLVQLHEMLAVALLGQRDHAAAQAAYNEALAIARNRVVDDAGDPSWKDLVLSLETARAAASK